MKEKMNNGTVFHFHMKGPFEWPPNMAFTAWENFSDTSELTSCEVWCKGVTLVIRVSVVYYFLFLSMMLECKNHKIIQCFWKGKKRNNATFVFVSFE